MPSSGRRLWVAAAVLMLTMGERATLRAGPPPSVPLPSCRLSVFLLVDQGVLTTQQRDVVRAEVTRTWRPYGLAIEWRTVPGTYVRGTVSVMVRDTFPTVAKSGARGGVTVAWTMFTENGPLPFIRASAAAARAVAASARVGGRDVPMLPEVTQQEYVAKVLGRSIAHEVGHYLLGKGHAEFGLMRAVIPPDDYFGARLHFTLTRAEVAALARSPVWLACQAEAATRSPAG